MSLYLIDDTNLIDIDKMTNACLVKNADESFTISKIVGSADRFSANLYVSLSAGTYQMSCVKIDSTANASFRARYTDGTWSAAFALPTASVTFDKPVSYVQFFLAFSSTTGQYYTFKEFMLNEGPTAKPFRPYRNPVKVQAMDVRDWDCTEVSGSFTDRSTADGLDIIDEKNARLDSVGGSTVGFDGNLCPWPYAAVKNGDVKYGITFTVDDGGVITVTGSTNASFNAVLYDYFPVSAGQTFAFSSGQSTVLSNCKLAFITYDSDKKNSTYSIDRPGGTKFTIPDGKAYGRLVINFGDGTTVDNLVFKPMINAGETALPWKPRFQGLKNSSFKGLKSIGKNIVDCSRDEVSSFGVTYSAKSPYIYINGTSEYDHRITLTSFMTLPAGTYTICLKLVSGDWSSASESYNSLLFYLYKTTGTSVLWNIIAEMSFSQSTIQKSATFTLTEETTFVLAPYLRGERYNKCIFACQIVLGETANYDFEPYKESLYELPEGIELGQWDSFDPRTGELTVGTKTIAFDGTEDWHVTDTNVSTSIYRNALALDDVDPFSDVTAPAWLVSNFYTTMSANKNWVGNVSIGLHGRGLIVYDKTYNTSDVSLWKAHLAELAAAGNPLKVAYKLATPEVVKLPDIPKRFYTAWNGGRETLIPGTEDNSIYGAIPTVNATYKAKTNEPIVVLKDIKIKESNIE